MKIIKSIQTFGSLFFLIALFGIYSCVEDVDPISDIETETTIPIAELVSIKLINPIDTLVISNIHKYKVEGFYSDNSVKDLSDSVMVLALSNSITKIDSSSFTTGKSGHVKIKIIYKEKFVAEDEFHSYEIENVPIDERFKTKGNCTIEVPTVLINLLPTLDGVNHNEEVGPSDYGNLLYPSLDRVKMKIYDDLVVSKRMVEMGTMFRDYGKKQVDPYACIKVVRIINVYEWQFRPHPYLINAVDYQDLFKRLNMEGIMDETSFKEVWITFFPKHDYPSVRNSPFNDPKTYWDIPESNMSSPTTGDVSNSHRIPNELPLYKSTYVIYGNNAHRGVDTNLHNRGHQLERQMRYIQSLELGNDLFNDEFIGYNIKQREWINKGNEHPDGEDPKDDEYSYRMLGRCGDTHFPPNAENDYDYSQSKPFLSDIKTWKPGGGTFETTTYQTWTSIDYSSYGLTSRHYNNSTTDYNKDPHAKWMLFWFQSVPGKDNNIPYKRHTGDHIITNWWDIYFNWDDAIKSKKILYE